MAGDRFRNRVVFITGGASGMGAAHARRFVGEGAAVVIADIDETGGRGLVEELGERALFTRLDVTHASHWDDGVSAARQRFGEIDVLINNAAMVSSEPIDVADPDTFRMVLDVGLVGAFLGMRTVLPLMKARGTGVVLNIISAAGLIAVPSSAAYAAAKWGLRGLSRAAALDMARTGVRVNAVFPGPTNTPMMAGYGESYRNALVAHQAIPRWADPNDISAMVLFLASDEAAYCTGGEYSVDGGASLGASLFDQPTAL